MADVVAKKKGKMNNIEKWGKKKLAYPINNLDEAFYVFFHYEGEPDIPLELERRFRQTEPVLRYLTLRQETAFMPKRKTRVRKRKEEEAPEPIDEKEGVEEDSEALFGTEEPSEEN